MTDQKNGQEYLSFVLEKLQARLAEISQSLLDGQKEIENMHDYYWQNYTEMDQYGYEDYDNQQALLHQVNANQEQLLLRSRFRKMLDSPFFGRVDFRYDGDDEPEIFYIGIGNFAERPGELPLLSGIHDFFLDKTMKKEEFEYMVNRCYTMYMQQNNDVLFNLLDSHDTERLMNRFHDLDKFYQQLAILFTLPGSPCIYYGTEIAMEGAHDPDCRRCMPWSEINSEENQEKIATMRKLIMLRRNEKTCRSPHFHFPDTYENDRCVEYIKIDEEGNKMEVLLNTSEKEIKVKEAGEVLFAREFDGEILGVNGTLIRRI